jgi:nucleotide-binding universal stress UspA family protein
MSGSVTPDVSAPAARPAPRDPFSRILLAVDLHDRAAPVPDRAWEIVCRPGSEVTICHVVMRPTSSAGNELDGEPANAEETKIVVDLRAAAIGALNEQGRKIAIKILHGDPGQRICEFADYRDATLIVLGPREKGSIAKSLKGSVSKYVVGNTRRTVLVIGD